MCARKSGKRGRAGRGRSHARPRTTHGGDTRGHARPDATGTVKINRRGYAFVSTSEGEYFVPANRLGGAMDGDTVVVRASHGTDGARRRGRILSVLERSTDVVIGTYERNGGLGIVRALDARVRFDIFTDAAASPQADTDDIVSVRITTYPSRNVSAMGVIEEVVGHVDEADIDQKVLIWKYGLETTFSQDAAEDAGKLAVDVDEALRDPLRRDLRGRFVFTIDPVDARDFDDAISVERVDGKVRLGVHIADVSHYVPWGSPIDVCARRRATSVYLADRVIPMIPESLSNGICSLNPDEDRLAFTVDMVCDEQGRVVSTDFYPSVIRSRARLDYGQVQACLDGEAPWPTGSVDDGGFAPDALERAVRDLVQLSEQQLAARTERGGIDFDGVEAKVVLDDDGNVSDILLRSRTQATGAIEEAMIMANEAVASFLAARTDRMVYRVHDRPDPDALLELVPLLEALGYPVEGLADASPFAVQRVLERAQERPEKELVSMKMLRAMKRAVYAVGNIGHFGLASPCYCHFTSPIRRYPDLIVHRLLRAQLEEMAASAEHPLQGDESPSEAIEAKKRSDARATADMASQLEWLAEHSSEMERVAADAAWDSVQMKLCTYMAAHADETFNGIITGVSTAGLMVTLPTTVKGLVPIRTLGDEYFVCDDLRMTLAGTETKTRWRIGQRVTVRVASVSVREMIVDFELV